MKSKMISLLFLISLISSPFANANDLNDLILQKLTLTLQDAENLINWKVGDEMNYNVSLGAFGQIGTMNKSVTKDEGAALWIKQALSLSGMQDTSEILINKADGKILKMIHNGQEQPVPNEEIEIISQDYTNVTVPAGTFDVIHVVAKTKQVKRMEIWSNPVKTVMDGAVKLAVAAQFGEIVMELTGFKHGAL